MPDPQNDGVFFKPVVIDDRFNSYNVKDLIKDRTRFEHVGQPDTPADPDLPELPLTRDGKLAPGVLYDSTKDPNVKYYLPEYVLRVENTLYRIRLRFRNVDEDPEGPIAFLIVELIASAPQDHRFTLKEIEHDAIVRLAYQVSVSDEVSDPVPPSTGIDDFVGVWINVDPATRGMTRLIVSRKTDHAGTFHGFGKCHPNDCDWGVIPATFSGGVMTGVYRHGFKDAHVTVRRAGELLHATVFSDYADTDTRSDRTDEYILRNTTPAPEPVTENPTFRIDIGTLEKVSATVRRCRLAIHSKEEYDRLLQIMTDPGHNAQLEVECQAQMGLRTWRQIFTGNVFEYTQKKSLSVVHVNPAALKARPDAPNEDGGETDPRPVFRPFRPVNRPHHLGGHRVSPVAFRHDRPTETVTREAAPVEATPSPMLARDVFRVAKDMDREIPGRVHHPVERPTKVPTRVVVDRRGQPVITRHTVSTVQTIRPFWFNLETHAYIFDVPETPTTRHVLLRRDVFVGDQAATFYQDSILREQVYYEPQAFGLARINASPYSPDLVFAFSDVSEGGEGDDVTIDYRVQLGYRVQADVDQRFLAQARLEFEPGVTFTALTPNEAALTMRLPSDEDETWIPVPRSEAEISFDEGILDEIELTSRQFQKVFSAFQAASSVGMEGTVQATLLDGTRIDIPVQVSLKDNIGTPFDASTVPTDVPGQYQINLTNRIESAVNINRVDPILLGSGIVAVPAGVSLPIRVEPGASATITYDVTSPLPPEVTLTPVVETTIDVDYERLWEKITTNQGFVNRTFDVRVSILPQFFAATPEGMEPLTSVVVEFDSFVAVELKPELTELTVSLRMPLLPVLLNQVEAAQTYRYRVVNQHESGPGAMSEWVQGSGDLQVVPPLGV